MRKMTTLKRLLSVILVLSVLLAWALPASAFERGTGFRQVGNDRVSASLFGKDPVDTDSDEKEYAPDDTVRVSIILEKKGTIDAGFAAQNISANKAAMAYRDGLRRDQAAMANLIKQTLREDLDIVWNMTLAANLISANVKYGQIEQIASLEGVKCVVVEEAYEPAVVEKNTTDPNMATSGEQIGSGISYDLGYTGAGSRIAIIDTGLDIDHLSFNAKAYEYSLAKQAEKANMTLEDYIASLNLLDADKIAALLPELNISDRVEVDAKSLYISSKIPFGFNYVDGNVNVTHLYDVQGEHGSHVAGIAAANAYVPDGEGFASALETVLVQGVAPDAQLIVMKVFGANGGAYPSDYMVAIEDAIMLDCDSVNLSLGSSAPGMTYVATAAYQKILDGLLNSGVVVSISAGNAGSWADSIETGASYLYSDDVGMHTGGSPGSYTNSLGVASVNNSGWTQLYLEVGGQKITYYESLSADYPNQSILTIAGTHEYVFVNGIGTAEQFNAIGPDVLKDKIVLCYRGETSFADKANAAMANGAAGLIVVNNQAGALYLNLTGYTYTAPVVAITQANGELFKSADAAVTDGENVLYWTGSMKVSDSFGTGSLNEDYYTMSSFSSWGVPGSLVMKPEITAPGGNIYSVGGAYNTGAGVTLGDHASYENMSGTSMAAPQVAGMAALMAQYIRQKGLEEKTGLDARTLAQSLLMSTAEPIVDGTSKSYYSILQQGAGLANVGAAVMADSYVMMGADATDSYADGKVKVELGDDPDRKGVYSFSFTIYNLSGEAETYRLSADFFIQRPATNGKGTFFMNQYTIVLGETVTSFTVGSEQTTSVTVPANGSVTVSVKVTLAEEDKEDIDQYFPNGTYLQGYVYAESAASEEGVEGTGHSIPVLGFYGNWTDASMYDKGSYEAYVSGEETRAPYLYSTNFLNGRYNGLLITYADQPDLEYWFGGNPYAEDAVYMPERNAINTANGDYLSTLMFTLIRNAAASKYQVWNAETGEYYIDELVTSGSGLTSAYYNASSAAWKNTSYTLALSPLPASIANNTRLEVGITSAPEYYLNADGSINWKELGDGATLSMGVTVDNEAPVLKNVSINLIGNTLDVQVVDNQYIAAIGLFDASGKHLWTSAGSDPNQKAGDTVSYALDLKDVNGLSFLLQVYDYAGNTVTYEIKQQIGQIVDYVETITVSPEKQTLVPGNKIALEASVMPLNARDASVTWSSSDEAIATVDENGVVTTHSAGVVTITATSVLSPEVSGSCQIEVVSIATKLNAFVWDAEGNVSYANFDTSDPTTINLSDADLGGLEIAAACIAPDGTIYASTMIDSTTGVASVYKIDQDTLKVTYLYDCDSSMFNGTIFYTEMTWAPGLYRTGGIIVSYASYVLALNVETGKIELIDQLDESIVGLATVGGAYYGGSYDQSQDLVFLIQADGTVVMEYYFGLYSQGAILPYYQYTTGKRMSVSTGISVGDSWYCSSAYYDQNYLYWSAVNFDDPSNAARLYALQIGENANGLVLENAFDLGQFPEGCWPIAGLHQPVCRHTNTVSRDGYAPSCTEPGYTGDVYCADCGELVGYGDEIPATGHLHKELCDARETSCDIPGYTGDIRCADCGELLEAGTVIPATGHQRIVARDASPATCTQPGYSGDIICLDCGAVLTKGNEIAATGHKNTEIRNASEATCTAEGYTGDTYCTDCGEKIAEGEKIAALGHGETEVRDASEATCTADGYTGDTYCTVCGEKVASGEKIAAKGHGKTEVRNASEATCTAEGYTGDTYCTVCGEKVTSGEKIAAKGHKIEVRNASEATCTAEAYTGDTYCTVCGEKVTSGETIAKKAHSYTSVVTEPTREAGGYTTHTCSVCGDSFVDSQTDPVSADHTVVIVLAAVVVVGGGAAAAWFFLKKKRF